tara:strand:- start:98 stop:394 length:297 start_codon:yes stop_codon:yes gene_type:complete
VVVEEDMETIILEVTEDRLEVVAVWQGVQILLLVMVGLAVVVIMVRGVVALEVRHTIIIIALMKIIQETVQITAFLIIHLLALLVLKMVGLEMVAVLA